VALALVFSLSVVAVPAQSEIVEAVVATVGSEVILHSDIMATIQPFVRDLQSSGISEEEFNRRANALFEQALNEAIENKILIREALLAGIEVEEGLVDERLEENKDLVKERLAMGETMSELRDHLRKQILAWRMARTKQLEFEQEAIVSEADVRAYYDDHRAEFERPERVRVRQIFLAVPEGSPQRKRATAMLESLRDDLAAGADFAALAEQYSQGPGADQGGLIGWVSKGDLDPVLEKSVLNLAAGQVSDVVERASGVHLLKVDERQEAGAMSLDEARPLIEPELRAQYAAERYKKWMTELRKRSHVRILY